MKRSIALLLLLALILSLTACGGEKPEIQNETEETPSPTAAPAVPAETEEPVFGADLQGEGGGRFFTPENIEMPEAGLSFFDSALAGDRVLLYNCDSDRNGSLYALDLNTLALTKISGQWGDIQAIGGYPDGSGAVLSKLSDESYRLSAVGADGSVTAMDLPNFGESYFISVHVSSGGYILGGGSNFIALDRSGQELKRFAAGLNRLKAVRSGDKTLLASQDEKGTLIRELDKNFKVTAEYHCKGIYDDFYDAPTGVFALAGSVIYRLDYTKDQREGFVSCFASGIKTEYFTYINDDCIFALNMFVPALWTPSENGDLTILRLATYDDSGYVAMMVRDFNESSDKYKIDLIDYAAYDEAGGQDTGLTRLNMDILSGNAPDIFDLSVLYGYDYGKKGLLEDLKPWFDRDETLSYDSLLPGAVRLLEQDGRLYDLVPVFFINTYCAPAWLLEDGENWTLNELFAMAEDYGMQQIFGPRKTREDFLTEVLLYDRGEFVDEENASCCFDDPRFIRLLELSAQLVDGQGGPFFGFPSALVYTGRQMVYNPLINTYPIDSINEANSVYGGDAAFAGFPSDSGTGTAMWPFFHLGMYSGSANKEGVWEFFRFLLCGEYLSRRYEEVCAYELPGIPLVKEELEKRIPAWNAFCARETNSTIVSDIGTAGQQLERVTIEKLPIDGSEADTLMALIDRMDCLYEQDQRLLDIVLREARAFYSGDKTAEQAAKLIQSKASIYLAEQYG